MDKRARGYHSEHRYRLAREELFSLRWPQIDLERGVILTTTLTKNGRARMVPLPERSRTVLSTIARRIDTDYVLVNPSTGSRFVSMDNGFHGALRRAKITDLRWHDLRRTAGCRWLQRDGKTIAEVSLLLGHSSVKVTEDRYAFLEAETVAQSLSRRTKVGTSATHCLSDFAKGAKTLREACDVSDSVNLG